MDLNKDFFDRIINPFFKEISVRNLSIGLEQYELYVKKKYASLKRDECLKLIKENLFSNRISSYNFESPLPSKDELSKRIKQLMLVEILFKNKLIQKETKTVGDETKDLFIYLIGIQTYMSSYRLEQIIQINIYIDFCKKIIKLFKNNEFKLDDINKKWFNFLKRCLYLTIHETRFELKEDVYKECILLMRDDIEYSKKNLLKEYLFALNNYINIAFDHIFLSINNSANYIDIEEFKKYYDDYQNTCIKYIKEGTKNNFLLYKIFSVFFIRNIYNLKLNIKKKNKIEDNFRIILLKQCTELIKIFYGKEVNYNIFINQKDASFSHDYTTALKGFSAQISILLNESNINVIDPLFLVFNYLSNFSEYLKLNINIYNRINFMSEKYFYRKVYILSTILYIKSFKDMEKFKKEIIKVKRNIELNPIISLISFYNNEIESMYELPPNLISYYKADPNIILIHEKIYYVNKIIFNEINSYKTEEIYDADYKVKIEFLFNIQNEIKNMLIFVSDPSIILDLGQFYSFFIDNFIKSQGMDYREDFLNKAINVKMSSLDINPLNFSIALLFLKLGKLKLVINHKKPAKLAIKKKMLTHLEKEEMGHYLDYTPKYFQVDDKRFDWKSIGKAIKNLRTPAVAENSIAMPDSRILKVICAIISKITKQTVQISQIFPLLLDESFLPIKKEWDIDPIILFYFNTYFTRTGKQVFLLENTGEKIEVNFKSVGNSLTFEKINSYIRDLLENTKLTNESITDQLEEITKLNEESLLDENDNMKNIELTEIRQYIKQDKSIYFERYIIKPVDKIYLTDILNNFLTAIGKSKIGNIFKYILMELIENANLANYKRAHFIYKNMDISTKYIIGMINFMENLETKKPEYIELIKNHKFKIKIYFKVFSDNFTVSVSNNYKIHPEEIKMIDLFVQKSKQCKNLKDAYKLINIDTRQGRGLGIITIMLFLRKFGISTKFFKLNIKDDESTIKIIIPFNIVSHEDEIAIAEEISKDIDTIPMMPENIQELKRKIKDPEVKLEDLERLILTDPSLSADIIRIANSAFYMMQNPVSNVLESIKIIGTTGIDNIISISAGYRLLENKSSKAKIQEIINHSEITAFYAKELARILKIKINIDDIYLASLLHDIGKIIVEGVNPDIYKDIQITIKNKNIPVDVLEDIAGGINHALIGNIIAKKWKFPPLICEVIRCHHNPREAASHADAVFLVYLANIYTYYNAEKLLFENIDTNVLEYFEINSKDRVKEISNLIQEAYDNR